MIEVRKAYRKSTGNTWHRKLKPREENEKLSKMHKKLIRTQFSGVAQNYESNSERVLLDRLTIKVTTMLYADFQVIKGLENADDTVVSDLEMKIAYESQNAANAALFAFRTTMKRTRVEHIYRVVRDNSEDVTAALKRYHL